MHTSQLDLVEAAAAEALASGSWADLQQLLPSVLSAADVALLLNECPTVENLSASYQPRVRLAQLGGTAACNACGSPAALPHPKLWQVGFIQVL